MTGIAGNMITRASLRNEQLLSSEIALPTKEMQLSIAQILRQYDLLIENCKRQIALLEEAVQRLYKEWFVGLHFPGYEETTIGENNFSSVIVNYFSKRETLRKQINNLIQAKEILLPRLMSGQIEINV